MAKDGSARGGPRVGAGMKKKALTEKLASGNPGGRKLMVLDAPEMPADPDFPEMTELTGENMPEIKSYMTEHQKNGGDLEAAEVFAETWRWLRDRGCDRFVSPQLVRNYAMSVSRWIQCEHAVSEYGFLAKHPTTGQPVSSPYVSMSQNYMKQVNNLWFQIFQIVKENCSVEFSGPTPQDDVMERILRAQKA